MTHPMFKWHALTGKVASFEADGEVPPDSDAATLLRDVLLMLPRVPGMGDDAHIKAAGVLINAGIMEVQFRFRRRGALEVRHRPGPKAHLYQ